MTDISGLTIFIPVFNEEALLENNILNLQDYLWNLGHPFEIIIGSNGSYDRTLDILARLKSSTNGLDCFHIPEKAVGKAFRMGFERARYNRFICLDMDLSIDLRFVAQAFSLLTTADVVVGSKINGDQKRSKLRTSASNAFIFTAKALLGLSFSDYSIAAKAYRKSAVAPYLHRTDHNTFYVTEILYRAHRDGKTIVEIPVDCHDTRPSRFNLIHEGWYKFSRLFLLFTREKIMKPARPFLTRFP